MLAYNKDLFNNTRLVDEAEKLMKAKFISKQQLQFIESKLPVYHKHSNLFARVGLMLLGFALYSTCCSFLGLIAMPLNFDSTLPYFFLMNAVAGFIALEFIFIRNLKYYRNGMDDAFLISAQASLLLFIGFLYRDFDHLSGLFMAAAVLGCICCLRYADCFSALLACVGITAFIINLCLASGSIGKMILPFVCMLVAAAIYIACNSFKKFSQNGYYSTSLEVCLAYACLLFYCSGNYLVVRELSEMLLGTRIVPGSDIPFAPFFYAFTFLCPLLFIVVSLQKKNRVLFYIGLVTFTFSIVTIRFYYHVLPTELSLILGGLMLFGIAFFAIRRLKGKTVGLTFEHDHASASNDLLALEALWLIENYHGHTAAPNANATGGGGEFGGAGSSGKF